MPRAAPAPLKEEIAEVDDADLDAELVDALRDLSGLQDAASQERLDRIEALPAAQLKPALRALLNSLPPGQLDELGASSDEEDDEASARPPRPSGRVVALAPARVPCFKGHVLTPMLCRPPDYDGQDGPDEFVCDICGIEDQMYAAGVYHCCECKEWDACVFCAGSADYAVAVEVPAGVRARPDDQKQQVVRRKKKGGGGGGGKKRGKRR